MDRVSAEFGAGSAAQALPGECNSLKFSPCPPK